MSRAWDLRSPGSFRMRRGLYDARIIPIHPGLRDLGGEPVFPESLGSYMTIDQGFAQVRTWLVRVIGIAFLVLIAALLLSRFGVVLPVALPSPEWMAYLAGAYWLVR